jgi:hypothetical protein
VPRASNPRPHERPELRLLSSCFFLYLHGFLEASSTHLEPPPRFPVFSSSPRTASNMAKPIRSQHDDAADSESAALTQHYDGLHDARARSPSRVPTHSFDTSDCTLNAGEREDATAARYARQHRGNWWSATKDIMTIRSRRKISLESDASDYKDDFLSEGEGLVSDNYTMRRTRTRRKRNCWNYCIFGGISGLTIL